MAMIGRWALLLGGVGVIMPIALIAQRLASGDVPPAEPPAPVEWRTPPQLSAALARPLFTATGESAALPPDAPELVGIVGRLDVDAVALVKTQDGTTRMLKPGEGVDGWQLRGLAIDSAYFTRGTQEARVTLSADQ